MQVLACTQKFTRDVASFLTPKIKKATNSSSNDKRNSPVEKVSKQTTTLVSETQTIEVEENMSHL
jgi:hypothetical protein